MSTLTVTDTLKSIRETLCLAQHAVAHRHHDIAKIRHDSDLIQRLINDIDRQRPLGSDGKHGDRHTASCGCEDQA